MSREQRYGFQSGSPGRRGNYPSPEGSPARSWRSRSPYGSRSRSRSRNASYSPIPKHRGHSRSHSPPPQRRSRRTYSRSYSRSRSRSGSRSRYHRRRYSRSRSRSGSPYRRGRYRGRPGSTCRSPFSDRKRHQGNRFNPSPSRVLGVFGLSLYTGDKDLKDMFAKFGPIEEVQVVYDHQTGRSRGFAFIYYEDIDDAIDAKEHCNGLELDGRRIRVDYSITKRAHTPTPGVYMGRPTRSSYDDRGYGSSRSYDERDDYYSDRGRGYYY